MSKSLLISQLLYREILGADELNHSFRDLKCPLVGIVDTSSSIRLKWVVPRAPGPDIVTALYQITVDNVTVPRQVESSIPTFAMAGGFI